jgi:hypothetical protein
MEVATDRGFALASSPEEVALRRKLLFRLLRDFDFSRPRLKGEFISDPVPSDSGARPPAPAR